MSKRLIAILIAISFTGVGVFIIFNNCAEANCWVRVDAVDSANAIWGSSSTDVFVAGKGAIKHYDGTNWPQFDCVQNTALYSIWGSSNTDVYAVGEHGSIVHFDGSKCQYIDYTVSGDHPSLLNSIWGSSASDVYAVGGRGTILHTADSGLNWSRQISSTTTNITDIWGSSSTDVFAVGDSGTILHYDGSNWSTMYQNDRYQFKSIWGFSKNDVYVGGFAIGSTSYTGVIIHSGC